MIPCALDLGHKASRGVHRVSHCQSFPRATKGQAGRLYLGAVSPPLSLPLFLLFYQCGRCPLSPFHVGAHGWVTRICHSWEQSLFESWLPIVKTPLCIRHPTSTSQGSLWSYSVENCINVSINNVIFHSTTV